MIQSAAYLTSINISLQQLMGLIKIIQINTLDPQISVNLNNSFQKFQARLSLRRLNSNNQINLRSKRTRARLKDILQGNSLKYKLPRIVRIVLNK
jgi:hypothetical protein